MIDSNCNHEVQVHPFSSGFRQWRQGIICDFLGEATSEATLKNILDLINTTKRQWSRSALVQIMACRLNGAKPFKYQTFHSLKCISKCRVGNSGHFAKGDELIHSMPGSRDTVACDCNLPEILFNGHASCDWGGVQAPSWYDLCVLEIYLSWSYQDVS